MTAPALSVVALRSFGSAGALVIVRSGEPGTIVRLGGSASDTLRLAGATGLGIEIVCDGSAWRFRPAQGRLRRVRDGETLAIGPWSVLLLTGDLAPTDEAGPAPRFELPDGTGLPIPSGVPVLAGSLPCCAVRVPELGVPVAAVLRRSEDGATWLYPVEAVGLTRNGARLRTPIALEDGDTVEAAGVRVLYADPRASLDRLLGELRGQPQPGPTPQPRLTRLELLLFALATGVGLGFCSVAWWRW